jgi:Recombination endonuclease VII
MFSFEVDHCHRHGWVRGFVCRSCNNTLPVIERGGRPYPATDEYVLGHHDVRLTVRDFDRYLQNCPVFDVNRLLR